MKEKYYLFRKKLYFLYKERIRIEKLKIIEHQLFNYGFRFIAGIDEVGRGALAGPVVAAAVIIKDIDSFFITDLKDSKKINRRKRENLSKLIREKSYDIGIGIVDSATIDRINVLQATLLAMKRAIVSLKHYPDYLLVDALSIPLVGIPQQSIIKGEDKSISIAAASIVAKVYRDNLMKKYHEQYPYYLFDKNAGYGTKNHLTAIKIHGICPIHRKSFKGVLINENNFSKLF